MTPLTKIFETLHLSKKSLAVFKMVIEKGPISATFIARELTMPRATAYFELDELLRAGLISISGSSGRRKFLVGKPDQIASIIETKIQSLSGFLPMAKKIAEDIQGFLNKKPLLPEIKFYSGVEGIKKVLDSTFSARSKEVLGILPVLDIYKIVGGKYLSGLIKKRTQKGVRVRNIWPYEELPDILQNHKEQLREIRFSQEKIKFRSALITYDDIVILVTSTQEPLSIMIKSSDLADAIKFLFEIYWEKSKNFTI